MSSYEVSILHEFDLAEISYDFLVKAPQYTMKAPTVSSVMHHRKLFDESPLIVTYVLT